jgi:hypothetical protein
MNSTKGYYSIIQYCPDASRLEAVNIGVALFCPEIRFLQARFGRRRTRVQQLFGKQDWEFVALQQAAIEARLCRESETFERLDDFEAYVSRRSNALTLTSPRPLKVVNPVAELKHLLHRLVATQGEQAQRSARISRELGEFFQNAGVVGRLKTNVTIHPPALPKPIKAPFAYQNGRLNLIEPVQFEGHSPAAIFNKSSILSVEGEFLKDYKESEYGSLGLIVVAKFAPGQGRDRETAQAVFHKHGVPMYSFGELDPLIADIRQHAH